MVGSEPVTKTLLFSDIEGSTQLLHTLGESYAGVLGEHHAILRGAFERHGGQEVSTEGDSFFVVFGAAREAVAASLEAQRGLATHRWPAGARVRVRMGLHTGEPEAFEDNLVGLDVHLAARVAAAAHGGQVVMTAATAELTAGHLPHGVGLFDLGWHRLKDIPTPQHLYELTSEGRPPDRRRLRSLGTIGHLPAADGALVGRVRELDEVSDALLRPARRLVTITGPGGAGKTRLATAVARRVADHFPDGVFMVELAEVVEPAVVWTTIAETLGMMNDTDSMEALGAALSSRRLLLVLDNLEQLPDAGAEVVATLLTATAGVRVLATSRRPLHLAAEQEYPLGVLGLPDAEAHPSPAEALRSEAVALFVERARLVNPAFTVSEDNVADVVALCRRLDGLPLALELAAARTRLMTPRAVLDHLEVALEIPNAGAGHPSRQRTLGATVEWSYHLLDPGLQRAFRGLGVFAGGVELDAMAVVVDVDQPLSVMAQLLDASLLTVDEGVGDLPRVRLLQTIRPFAWRLAAEAGELSFLRQRHATHYLRVAEASVDKLHGPDARGARRGVERELPNLRDALEWGLGDEALSDHGPGAEARLAIGVRLATAMGKFWYRTGYTAESGQWLERGSRVASANQGPELAQVLHGLGLLLLQQGQYLTGRDVLAKCLRIWRRMGDRVQEATELNSLGVAYRSLGEPQRAREHLEASIALARDLHHDMRLATALSNLALLEIDQGRADAALRLLGEAESLDLRLGDSWAVTVDQANAAAALVVAGRASEAAARLGALVPAAVALGDPDLTANLLELAAAAASERSDHRTAVRLAAAAAAERRRARVPLTEPDERFLERYLAASRARLGADLKRELQAGAALTVDEAVALVGVPPGAAAPEGA